MLAVPPHALAVKVYRELNKCSIVDYDVVPDSIRSWSSNPCGFRQTCVNTDAVFVVENHLGFSAYCVPPLYRHCYEGLFEARRLHLAGENEGSSRDFEQGDCVSCVLMLLNPELAAGWNYRKKLIIAHKICVAFELWLTALVLTKHPQSSETFSHRRWLLRFQPNASASAFTAEAAVCEAAARRYRSNYHAWSHRQWALVNLIRRAESDAFNNEEGDKVLVRELQETARFCDEFMSDYSGLHYRQFVLARVWDLTVRSQFLVDELMRTKNTMQYFGLGFEALWYHRRAVVYMLVSYREGDNTNERRFAESQRLCADELAFASALAAPLLYELGHNDATSSMTWSSPSTVDWSATQIRRYLRWLRWLAGCGQRPSSGAPK